MRIKTLLLLIGMSSAISLKAQQTMGFFTNEAGSQDGYVLFAPIFSGNTYLIDKCGKQVHQWTGTNKPGQSVYLLPDGSLLRPGNANNAVFNAGGSGGVIERFDWNSNLLWTYTISDALKCQHHDICYLPNGNILAIAWEKKTVTEALAEGRNPALLGSALWSEQILELQPTGTNTANIVWEWHAWDHLTQDYSASLPAFGVTSAHPELINLNYYTGTANNSDWLHINSVSYNAALDQVMLSVHNFNEVWVIDHSSTTIEAAGHSGGTRGKGGDLLYRWGNAAAYDRGTPTDKKLYGQHNAQWIANGLVDSGKIMVFNNGQGRPGGNYSTIDIIDPPIDQNGNYTLTPGNSYLPDTAYMAYKAAIPADFFAANISGAQRLKNGNTLICSGPSGEFFEVDATKHTVWKYINPVNATGAMTQGATPTQNLVFRCTLYEGAYPGFTGHNLVAGAPIEVNPIAYSCIPNAIQDVQKGTGMVLTAVNPFYQSIQLKASRKLDNVRVLLKGISGVEMAAWDNVRLVKDGLHSFPLSFDLPGGMYILTVVSGGDVYNIRLVKE
jgi:hypothetical protein